MDLLTNEDILNIVSQLGYKKALRWSIENYSDEILGYLGEHLTLTVVVDSKDELKFFVKCLPRFDKWKAEYITEHGFFEKEYAMVHSLFEKFEQGKDKWRPTLFLAKRHFFVFEDIVQLGYAMPRDQDTLALRQVEACIVTMARFHAKSYIYEDKKSIELNRSFTIWENYGTYLQESNKNQNWRNAGVNAAIHLLKVYSNFRHHPNFEQRIETILPKLCVESLSLTKPHSVYRNVVVHRDLWMNNLFFKNGLVGKLEAVFIDFQTVLYCPPMLDLASFLYFNTRRNFRDNYLHQLINLYYYILLKELKAVNIDIDNIMDRESMNECYNIFIKFGVMQASVLVPITLISKETKDKIFCLPEMVYKFYEISRSEEMLEIAKNDERYRSHVMELFDEILERYIY